MQQFSEKDAERLIAREEGKLAEVCGLVDHYDSRRKQEIEAFIKQVKALEAERLAARNWQEKRDLANKIEAKKAYHPEKWLPPFSQSKSPYFASLSVIDNVDGHLEYWIGKQGLADDTHKVSVVDWRAPMAKLYFGDELPGEEYEETIGARDREGVVRDKAAYVIKERELKQIASKLCGTFNRGSDGAWVEIARSISPTQLKEEKHQLPDVVGLLSREQYEIVSRYGTGAMAITGVAGSGKTTALLLRLSWLFYNFKDRISPGKSLILVFNRVLRDYLAASIEEHVGSKVAVETFAGWSMRALRAAKVYVDFTTNVPAAHEYVRRDPGMAAALREYASARPPAQPADLLAAMLDMYSDEDLLRRHITEAAQAKVTGFAAYYRKIRGKAGSKAASLSDAPVLVRLLQLWQAKQSSLLNHYDAIAVDEAQDHDRVTLDVIYDLCRRNEQDERCLTVAADFRQKILDFVGPGGITGFINDLGAGKVMESTLLVGYRSTRQIMEVANAIKALDTAGEGRRDGPAPMFTACHDRVAGVGRLKETLIRERETDPKGLTAVICKSKAEAEALFRECSDVPGCRFETDKHSFAPGTVFVSIYHVKGVEFTSVVFWQATAKNYRDTATDRSLAYVIATRACDRLYVHAHGGRPAAFLESYFSNNQT